MRIGMLLDPVLVEPNALLDMRQKESVARAQVGR
jgi:hypothetical protein